jgi:hypothetical protein
MHECSRAARGVILAGALLVAAAPARAQGIAIAWQDCRDPGGSGFASQNYGCTSNIVTIPLFPSFTLATAVDSVWAMELVIDVAVAEAELPVWWRMEPGGCRAGGWAADASLAGSCSDAWNGKGTAASQGWLPGQPGAAANHGRLLVAASVLTEDAVALDADVPYTAARVLLRTNNTTDCQGGCLSHACLVFNSLLLRRLPGSSVEEVLLSVAQSPGSNMITWQGSGADCQSVPARRSTWGAVKALYR